MTARTIAIGDIHGCSVGLSALLRVIDPQPSDTIVALGDFVDRGPDSKGVLEQLIALPERCRLVPILGNHEEMMLHARDGKSDRRFWINCGGRKTLDSYQSDKLGAIPRGHFRFLESCVPYHETDDHVFLHANYKPEVLLARLDEHTLRWLLLTDYIPPRQHCSGKVAIVGHTPHDEALDLGYLKCIDTGCGTGGWLTAIDVYSGQTWQVNEAGKPR